MPTQVRKALISSFGDVSCVSVVDSTIPDPPDSHVQVKVIYSGFAGADINMRLGVYPLQRKAPLTPGYCFVGTVARNGPRTTGRFAKGDLVACCTVYDSEATFINQPEKYLIPVPAGLDLQKVTALIIDWNTAFAMVNRSAKVQEGQRVFVHGMSGAVGSAVAALCRMKGADVYGTASERNHAAIRELGGVPFVYSNKEWVAAMKKLGGVHAVFDPLGFESWDESFEILDGKEGGILVGYGQNQASLNDEGARSILMPTMKLFARGMSPFSKKRTAFYYITRDQKTFEPDLKTLFEMLQQGKIDVRIKSVWDLEDIQEAHRSWGKTGSIGSSIIRVEGSSL